MVNTTVVSASKLLILKISVPGAMRAMSFSEKQEVLGTEDVDIVSFLVAKDLYKHPAYSKVISCANAIKKELSAIAIPWPGISSLYIVPEKLESKIQEFLERAQEEFQEEVENFIKAYPEIKQKAKERLGTFFSEDDYPSVETLRSKFKYYYMYIRIDLPETYKEQLTAQLKEEWQSLSEKLSASFRASFLELVNKLKNSCDTSKARKAPLRRSTFNRLLEFVKNFEDRNIIGDNELASYVKQLDEILDGVNYEALKQDDVRKEIFDAVNKLANSMTDVRAIDVENNEEDIKENQESDVDRDVTPDSGNFAED